MPLRKAFADDMPRTYATYDNAEKALHRAVAKLGGITEDLTYVIAATPAGRYYPVTVPREDQVQLATVLAWNGIALVRR